MRQSAFLAALLLGLVALLSGVTWTRLHWRADIGPYREKAWLDVLMHPERFAEGASIGRVRGLIRAGVVLLAAALGMAVLEIARLMLGR